MNHFRNIRCGLSINFNNLRAMGLAGLIAIGSTAPSLAQSSSSCTGGSVLSGSFGMYASGTTQTGVLKFLTGSVKFDGSCGLTAFITVNENGVTSPAFSATSGSYTPNGDGTVSMSFVVPGTNQTETYSIAYSPLFHEAIGDEIDSSAKATISLKAQGPVTFNNASLSGTFAASGSAGDAVTITFDGNGNVTGTDHSAMNPQVTFSGTYFVLPDGSVGGWITLGSNYLAIGGIIDNNSSEAQFVINSGNNGGWVPLEGLIAKRIK